MAAIFLGHNVLMIAHDILEAWGRLAYYIKIVIGI